jgi:A/G-specific adenine glycosylase
MTSFAHDVVRWQRAHGRHDLPWQTSRDPYRIWVSEIMLQQTQVATVIPYYERFMARFPDVRALANARLDDVLAHWSGLGYYSRARYLHNAALKIRDAHGSRFPRTHETIAALPGVGRSTAAAIAVFAFGARDAILDGNVKRVLARVCGIGGHAGEKATTERLWDAAESFLPDTNVEVYTQGLMDLGAMVCVRHRPKCYACPVASHCVALREGRTGELPTPRPRKVLPRRETVMLILEHEGKLLLEKRAAPGIWGGLWCFPEVSAVDDPIALCRHRFGAEVRPMKHLPKIEHGFTHFSLTISPQHLRVSSVIPCAGETEYQWLPNDEVRKAAIPAPVGRILEMVRESATSTHGT